MRRRNRRTVGGVIGLTLVLAACGSSKSASPSNTSGGAVTTAHGAPNPNAVEQVAPGDIPDNQVFVPYTPAAGGYSMSFPQGWARRETATATTFSQNFNSMELTTVKVASAPMIASARSLVSATLSSISGFKLIKIESVTRTSGPAIRIVYTATSGIDPVTSKAVALDVERYLFWHKGTLLTVTLSSAKGSDNVDPWKTVTNSVAWK
jgi:hypothetical protein